MSPKSFNWHNTHQKINPKYYSFIVRSKITDRHYKVRNFAEIKNFAWLWNFLLSLGLSLEVLTGSRSRLQHWQILHHWPRTGYYTLAVICPSHFCRVRITSPSSQSHLKFFRFIVRVMTWSSRIKVESKELSSRFESLVCNLESMSSFTKFHVSSTRFFSMKWRPICHKVVPDKLENGAQHAMKWHPIRKWCPTLF